MDKIILKHSRIEINDYEMGDAPRLEYLFSVWNPTYHQSFFKAIEYDEENKKLIIPRGFDINYLRNTFMCEPFVDKECDPFINSDPLPIKYLTKDDRQLEILKFILGEDKYFYTKSKSQLAINSTTGSGKTFITVATMCFTGSRTIIITNSIDWLNQWKDRILEYTQLDEKQIYMMTGSSSIHKILNRDPLQYQVILASHATIRSYGDKYGWNAVDELFKYLKCSLKVFDEAHLYFDNMCKIDYHSNTKKTLYLTATPARSSKEENEIYKMYFKNIPSISLFNEETDPHVNYCAMHFNSHPSPMDINKCKNQYGFDRNKYVSYIVNRPNFLKLVTILIDMVFNINGKILIYIGTNAGITTVYNYIINQFPFLNGHVGIYTSAVEKEFKEVNLYNKIILSTTKSCGAASDIKDLRCVINLAEPFRSEVLARQTLGRCREDNTLYIDVVDNGFFFTKKYYEAKKPIFSVYSKSCKDIFMSDEELENRSNIIEAKYNTKKVMCNTIYKQ
jgi:hypothetical protein